VGIPQEYGVAGETSEILPGTLDLMVLKTLASIGPSPGHGIARRIEQISGEALQISQGTIYAFPVRFMQRGWLSGAWARRKTTEKPNSIPSRKPDLSSSLPKRGIGERVSTAIGRVLRIAERG
jgi:PadR family transcriptional regulator PadR